jgi:hypothetical protein
MKHTVKLLKIWEQQWANQRFIRAAKTVMNLNKVAVIPICTILKHTDLQTTDRTRLSPPLHNNSGLSEIFLHVFTDFQTLWFSPLFLPGLQPLTRYRTMRPATIYLPLQDININTSEAWKTAQTAVEACDCLPAYRHGTPDLMTAFARARKWGCRLQKATMGKVLLLFVVVAP